jgi:ribonuclease E
MEEKRNNRAVERRLKDALRHDRARIQVGRISHFGLLEMSRQRLRTGVLEGSTSQCPHCQGTGIIRSVESVALAVLRALEDHLIRDSRNPVTAVTTADVALYILNNKRPFVTDMERRYSLTITVQASERMQGANFAIEKSAVQAAAPQKGHERSVVNMEWGFEGDAEAEEAAEETRPASHEGEDGGRRPRRRRRRGRRDDRPERSEHRHEHRSQSGRREAGGNGNAIEEIDTEDAQPADDLAASADMPAGLGEQPSLGREGEGEDDNGDRRGRRRRRGRRGGRRGRDREGARESGGDEIAAHDGNGADASAGEVPETFEPAAESAVTEQHERHYETTDAGQNREQAWHAPEPGRGPASESGPADREPEPSTAREAPSVTEEAPPDDPARPARKGWWQRKLLG